MRTDEETNTAAADGDRAGLFKAIISEEILVVFSLSSYSGSRRFLITPVVSRQSQAVAQRGGERLQETQRDTMLMIKDQLIRHLLCNLK